MEKKTEKQVREEAQKLARQIGDEEWEKGETKYALEAYEESDISAAELLEKAEKLLEAEKIIKEWIDIEEAAYKLPTKGHSASDGATCTRIECIRCKTLEDMEQRYENRITELLGWEEDVFFVCHGHTKDDYTHEFRAAAVACFKVIKRMFPEKE